MLTGPVRALFFTAAVAAVALDIHIGTCARPEKRPEHARNLGEGQNRRRNPRLTPRRCPVHSRILSILEESRVMRRAVDSGVGESSSSVCIGGSREALPGVGLTSAACVWSLASVASLGLPCVSKSVEASSKQQAAGRPVHHLQHPDILIVPSWFRSIPEPHPTAVLAVCVGHCCDRRRCSSSSWGRRVSPFAETTAESLTSESFLPRNPGRSCLDEGLIIPASLQSRKISPQVRIASNSRLP